MRYVLILLAILLFSGCHSPLEDWQKDTQTDELMLNALSAIKSNNQEDFYALFWREVIEPDDETAFFIQVREYFKGEIKSWEPVSGLIITAQIIGCNYFVKTDHDDYFVSAARKEVNGEVLLYTLNITRASEQADYLARIPPKGFLKDIPRFNDVQWFFFIMGVLSYGFVIFMIVLCIRDKIKKKPLFILMMLVQATVTLRVGGGAFLYFGVTTPTVFSGHLIYPNGNKITTLLIPLGAIIYRSIRQKLIRKARIAAERAAEITEITEHNNP